jgi:uncharacterized membrane protein YjjP (DUF1212 family)
MNTKPPLEHDALRDVIDLTLWTGQMLLQHGAESARIEETVHRMGTGLGADWLDILVSPNMIAATTVSGGEFRTKLRRIVAIGVNMQVIAEINDLSRKVTQGQLDRFQVRAELERIDKLPRQYNRWVVVVMVGLACGAFSRLFGGDWSVFMVTTAAASVAMWFRQEMARRYFNPLLIVTGTAFVAGLVASIASVWRLTDNPQIALSASVLLLVPGAALINAADDLLNGHLVIGITRGVTGLLISLGIALGLLLAMRLTGITGL